MISNKDTSTACVACSTPKPSSNVKPASSLTIAAKFAPAAGSWECETCLVANKAVAELCVACSTPNPKTKSSAPASSLVAKFAPPTGSWECSTCMISNKGSDKACVACSTPKPGSKATVDSGGGGGGGGGLKLTSNIFASSQPGTSAAATNTTPLSMFAPVKDSWSCDTCLISNKSSDDSCVACSAPKPGAKASSSSSSTFGASGGLVLGTSGGLVLGGSGGLKFGAEGNKGASALGGLKIGSGLGLSAENSGGFKLSGGLALGKKLEGSEGSNTGSGGSEGVKIGGEGGLKLGSGGLKLSGGLSLGGEGGSGGQAKPGLPLGTVNKGDNDSEKDGISTITSSGSSNTVTDVQQKPQFSGGFGVGGSSVFGSGGSLVGGLGQFPQGLKQGESGTLSLGGDSKNQPAFQLKDTTGSSLGGVQLKLGGMGGASQPSSLNPLTMGAPSFTFSAGKGQAAATSGAGSSLGGDIPFKLGGGGAQLFGSNSLKASASSVFGQTTVTKTPASLGQATSAGISLGHTSAASTSINLGQAGTLSGGINLGQAGTTSGGINLGKVGTSAGISLGQPGTASAGINLGQPRTTAPGLNLGQPGTGISLGQLPGASSAGVTVGQAALSAGGTSSLGQTGKNLFGIGSGQVSVSNPLASASPFVFSASKNQQSSTTATTAGPAIKFSLPSTSSSAPQQQSSLLQTTQPAAQFTFGGAQVPLSLGGAAGSSGGLTAATQSTNAPQKATQLTSIFGAATATVTAQNPVFQFSGGNFLCVLGYRVPS